MRLPRLLRTTSFRLTLLYAAVFTVSVTVLFGIIYWSTAGFLSQQLEESVDIELATILEGQPEAGLPRLIDEVEDRAKRAPAGAFYLLQARDGKVLAGNLPARPVVVGIVDTKGPELFEQEAEPHGFRGRGVVTTGNAYLLVANDNYQLEEIGRAHV